MSKLLVQFYGTFAQLAHRPLIRDERKNNAVVMHDGGNVTEFYPESFPEPATWNDNERYFV